MTDILSWLADWWRGLTRRNKRAVLVLVLMTGIYVVNSFIDDVNEGQLSADIEATASAVTANSAAKSARRKPLRMPPKRIVLRNPFEPQHRTREETERGLPLASASGNKASSPTMTGAVRLVGVVTSASGNAIAILSRQTGKDKEQQWSARVGESANGVKVLACEGDTATIATAAGIKTIRLER